MSECAQQGSSDLGMHKHVKAVESAVMALMVKLGRLKAWEQLNPTDSRVDHIANVKRFQICNFPTSKSENGHDAHHCTM